jgi:hypothetical protein
MEAALFVPVPARSVPFMDFGGASFFTPDKMGALWRLSFVSLALTLASSLASLF